MTAVGRDGDGLAVVVVDDDIDLGSGRHRLVLNGDRLTIAERKGGGGVVVAILVAVVAGHHVMGGGGLDLRPLGSL